MWPHDLSLPAQGLSIDRPNQVWAADICYLPMAKGFLYLVAIIDWYSRKVLAWRLSNTLDSHFWWRHLRYNLKSVRSYLLKEDFQQLGLHLTYLGGEVP